MQQRALPLGPSSFAPDMFRWTTTLEFCEGERNLSQQRLAPVEEDFSYLIGFGHDNARTEGQDEETCHIRATRSGVLCP